MRASILSSAIILLWAGALAACGGAPGGPASAEVRPVDWRVYQDTVERRRVEPDRHAEARYRLLQAPGFVRLEAGGRLVTDPARPMPLGRYRIVVRVETPGGARRVLLDLHVMPVV